MTWPAATVWPMSRIAKRPIWGNCLKASITRGFVGRILTRAASPVFRKSGFSGFGAPVFGSRAAMISSKVHATWAVWAWKTGVYPSDRDRPGARDRVDVLDREAEGQVRRLWRHLQVVERLDEVRALVPGHLLRRLRDVLALVRADRDERDLVHLVADAPEQRGEFRLQLVEARLRERRLRRVHLVDRADQLLDAARAREEDVFSRLRLHAFRAANDVHGRIRLGRAGNHVLDEVPVARGVDDREVVLVRVKALVRDVDRQAALPLLLHLVHDEGELERGLAHLLGEFLQVLEFVGVDVRRVVQDPADGRRLPVVDVADEH